MTAQLLFTRTSSFPYLYRHWGPKGSREARIDCGPALERHADEHGSTMDEKNIKLVLAYDGTNYHGWQRQKNGLSIQQVVEEKIATMTDGPVRLQASGRTDAGVHALGQVCNFTCRGRLTPLEFRKGLNAMLPEDIVVLEASSVPPEFHSRYSAKAKTYEYRILNTPEPDIFLRHYVWHISRPLDIEAISESLARLTGRWDFSSFQSAGSSVSNATRTIHRAEIQRGPGGVVSMVFEADGFLRHMVRNIVGTVVEAGEGKIGPADVSDILDGRDRSLAGVKAPARGLFLVKVTY
jgi:tRNA pseudouridine38-40 synthase